MHTVDRSILRSLTHTHRRDPTISRALACGHVSDSSMTLSRLLCVAVALLAVAVASGVSANDGTRGGAAHGSAAGSAATAPAPAAAAAAAEVAKLAAECDGGDGAACALVGSAHFTGEAGLRQDTAAAVKYATRACELDDAQGAGVPAVPPPGSGTPSTHARPANAAAAAAQAARIWGTCSTSPATRTTRAARLQRTGAGASWSRPSRARSWGSSTTRASGRHRRVRHAACDAVVCVRACVRACMFVRALCRACACACGRRRVLTEPCLCASYALHARPAAWQYSRTRAVAVHARAFNT